MAAPYTWLTKTAAVSALQGRLNSTTFWTADECWGYLVEGLRHWSAMAECWNADLVIPNANGSWINTGTLAGSPRLRTVTDVDLYTNMENMLLEPPTGGTWTGTNQFSISALQYALQKRTQEVIQASACNLGLLSVVAVPGTRDNALPDTVLEPRRIRFMAVSAQTTGTASTGDMAITLASSLGVYQNMVVVGAGVQPNTFVTSISGNVAGISLPVSAGLSATPLQFAQSVTLTREDTQAFDFFEPDYTNEFGLPQSWDIATEAPLAFDVDIAPNVPGTYDIIVLNAAATFAPPAATLLGIPDDWSWLPMYGALADLLGRESEATDRQRASYCLERYTQGLELMLKSNWLKQTQINGATADSTALASMDDYAPEWQASNDTLNSIVQAGIDFVAPTPGLGQSVGLTLVGNAPLLDSTNTYVQVSRDDFQAVLDYAQHVACWKQGGQEFSATYPLLKDFYRAVGERNKRWLSYGIFTDLINTEGQRQSEDEPR